jgi:hypothetical protein
MTAQFTPSTNPGLSWRRSSGDGSSQQSTYIYDIKYSTHMKYSRAKMAKAKVITRLWDTYVKAIPP